MGKFRPDPVLLASEVGAVRQKLVKEKREDAKKVEELRQQAVSSSTSTKDSQNIPNLFPVDKDLAKRTFSLEAFASP